VTSMKRRLPPDPEKLNDQRAGWAGDALTNFALATNMSVKHDKPEIVGDLLANIMHWCDRNSIDFDERLANARMHYAAETAREEGATP
jgi:hypothetical protein